MGWGVEGGINTVSLRRNWRENRGPAHQFQWAVEKSGFSFSFFFIVFVFTFDSSRFDFSNFCPSKSTFLFHKLPLSTILRLGFLSWTFWNWFYGQFTNCVFSQNVRCKISKFKLGSWLGKKRKKKLGLWYLGILRFRVLRWWLIWGKKFRW